ncbi:MAG: prepilin-type N-terminal cleavage/methylation domain-containing protein [Sedimentisphaerales bacterium]|nr:prepilin-type N-terminal cleavage/methylation domain-containing protein [Sedimentisphaerales bacterium]
MASKRPKSLAGITLIEVMAAIVIVSIAVLGASGYRYYSAMDTRKASLQSSAARIALLLCESWRGRGYDLVTTYDPSAHLGSDVEIDTSTTGPEYPFGFTPLGRYKITANDGDYWVSLSWKDDETTSGLRALNTVVAWAQGRSSTDSAGIVVMDKTFRLTTYVAQ